jgi:hypothetical protein
MPDTVDSKVVEQAGETLFDEIYIPAFCKQCEARGITFSSPEELQLGLQNVLLLKSAQTQEQSAASTNLHKTANLLLRQRFGEDVEAAEKQASDVAQVTAVTESLEVGEGALKAAALLASLNVAPEEIAA